MAKKISKSKARSIGIILEAHPQPIGSIDFGKNHFSTPKQYGQQFKVDNSYYRLSGKPTLGLPAGMIEPDPSDKLPKPMRKKAVKKPKRK
jgi:hypothetical protein